MKRVAIEGFVFTESVHEPHMALPEHAHANACVAVVLDGGFTETYAGGSFETEPWSMVVRPPGLEHSDRIHAQGCRALVVEVLPGRIDELRQSLPLLGEFRHVCGAGIAGTGKRLYAEFKSGDAFVEIALEGLLLELLAQAARAEQSPSATSEPHWLVRARGIMRDRFPENIGLSEVAACVGVHPVHLARTFREHHGATVGEHIRRLRIDYAAQHLAETPMPLAEIAERAGFSDQSHFCRLFRRHTGMTPSQFRKASRAS